MGNFDFAKATLPPVYPEAARAESYLISDPRSALFYSRRTAEVLIAYLYEVLALKRPYADDLSARINDPAFKNVVGESVAGRFNLIRKATNSAVHGSDPVPPQAALHIVRQVFHLVIWAAFKHSPYPNLVPLEAQFDPSLAPKASPLTTEEVRELAARFKAQDEAHARAMAERDEALDTYETQIAALKAQIDIAQAANNRIDDHNYDEAATRDIFIDVLLGEAGWSLDQPRDREYEVAPMPNAENKGFADYVLWGDDGLPLAVVEAKRARTSAQVGQRQAELYADALQAMTGRRPIIFYTNGYEHWIWDDAAGYPPRPVAGFYTKDELELTIQRRSTRTKLANAPVAGTIVERPYQIRAIRAVGDAFDKKQRDALLVMATGSGKTRTVIALVDQLQRANWTKRVLLLADRTALVNQASNAFRAFLPSSTTVNLTNRAERDTDGRVYVSTYPTMMNLINDVDDNGGVLQSRRFGPGFFDLVIIDEAHRSVYAKYGAIFDYFDSLLVGLTATPKDEVDHNTYRLFRLEDGVPTDAYSLAEAVSDGFLVPPKGYSVPLKFVRQGIKYDDLSDDEKDQWDELDWGDDGVIPSEIGAEEVNRFLFNEDTVDKVLATLMEHGYRVDGGDRVGKTIVFAKNQQHAEFIEERFNLAYPELAGKAARVITHASSYAQSLIDDFSQASNPLDIAISVDMLDTGIDVPEVVNLVFFKMVRSKSKFWQMIGRGTRLRPDLYGPGQDKQDFLVFDFCGNLEFFNQNLPGSDGQTHPSLSQRIFEARVSLVGALGEQEPDLKAATASTLRDIVAGMNLANFVVRPHRRAVERLKESVPWQHLTDDDRELAMSLAPLPSRLKDDDQDAKRFDLLILRRQLAQLNGDHAHAERLRETIQSIAAALLGKTAIPSVAAHAGLLESVADDEWWIDVTLSMLELLRLRVRGLIRLLERTRRDPVFVDLEDVLGEATEIALPGVTPGTNFERFRLKAQVYLKEHEGDLALQRLRRGHAITPSDIEVLAGLLHDAGGSDVEVARAREESGGLGSFIRSLVGLDGAAVQEAFAHYLDASAFTLDQIRFIGLVIDELTRNGAMKPARLYESPYTDHIASPESLFPEDDVDNIVSILRNLNASAEPNQVAS